MAEKTYDAFFNPSTNEMVGLVDFPGDVQNSLERINGEWVPLEQWSFDSLSGTAVDTMSEGIIEVFDAAEAENRTLNRSDVEQFIVESETK